MLRSLVEGRASAKFEFIQTFWKVCLHTFSRFKYSLNKSFSYNVHLRGRASAPQNSCRVVALDEHPSVRTSTSSSVAVIGCLWRSKETEASNSMRDSLQHISSSCAHFTSRTQIITLPPTFKDVVGNDLIVCFLALRCCEQKRHAVDYLH